MTRAFVNKQSIIWLIGVFVLIVGFFVAALVLPATSKLPDGAHPNVRVPKMQNVPPAEVPKMRLDTTQH